MTVWIGLFWLSIVLWLTWTWLVWREDQLRRRDKGLAEYGVPYFTGPLPGDDR